MATERNYHLAMRASPLLPSASDRDVIFISALAQRSLSLSVFIILQHRKSNILSIVSLDVKNIYICICSGYFLDQELIPYRYSSIVFVVLVGATLFITRAALSQGEPRDAAVNFDTSYVSNFTTASCVRFLGHSTAFLYIGLYQQPFEC